MRVVLDDAFLQAVAERIPEGGVFFRLVGRDGLQPGEHALGRALLHGLHGRAFLQHLARDVERQVGRVHHAAHEAQPARQDFLVRVHDVDAAHVELHAVTGVRVPEVERRLARQVEQQRVLELAFQVLMQPVQRLGEIVREVLVEGLVVVLGEFGLRPRPQGRGLVDRLHALALSLLHADGEGDVIGVLVNDGAQAPDVEELVGVLAQVQHDLGAAFGLLDGLDLVLAVAPGTPAHAMLASQARPAGGQRHFVGHEEGGIEANAELADQVCILLGIAGEALEELPRAGLGDGADMLDDFLAAHADAIVAHGDGARVLVHVDEHVQIGVALVQAVVGGGREAQLVGGVRGVGNQLAQEDFLVRIQGVDHQVQQLPNLGLECPFLGGCRAHAVFS